MTTAIVSPEVTAFLTAQRAHVESSEHTLFTFASSAMAASVALKVKGVILSRLAEANRLATEDLAPFAPKGTLYTSVEAVAYHALTGDLLCLAFDEDDEDDVFPYDVQTLIVKVKRVSHLGVKAVKAAIRQADSQQEAVRNLKDALKVPAPVTDDETDDDSETGDTGETSGETQTVETLLARAIALLTDGAELTDTVRAMIGELSTACESLPIAA